MLHKIALLLRDNIDPITREWVTELRRTGRTEVHNQLLTSEIVNGMKSMLANLADAIEQRESPDPDTELPLYLPHTLTEEPVPVVVEHGGRQFTLASPVTRARQTAAGHGKLRQAQHYELHEVVLEYVKLRHIIWDTLRREAEEREINSLHDMVGYIDGLIDELLLSTIDVYHSTSVHDLEKRAVRDPLTQLYNKEYFWQRLGEELRRALRTGEPVTVAMLDMDNLKRMNDSYGHPAGDAVISAVANALQTTCRQSDIPCRYGGDEFSVILPETNKGMARVFAERVMRAIAGIKVVVAAGGLLGASELSERGEQAKNGVGSADGTGASLLLPLAPVLSISVGLATFPHDGRNPETLVAKADSALYRAKREGRNRTV